GLNNRSFVVELDGREAVLRLDTEYTSTFGLDRSTEVRIHSAAAKQHLAPEVLFARPEAGILLYEYLAGPVWDRASLDDPRNLDRLAAVLREVHTQPAAGVTLDGEAAAERYAAAAYGKSGLSPFASRCLRIVRETPAAGPLACCHNDIVAENVVG